MTRQLEADDLWNQHGDRLTEHRGFCFDTADAPTKNAQAVDHGGVRVGAHQGVGVGLWAFTASIFKDNSREVLEVHLVHDTGVGGDHFEVFKSGLTPAKK